MTVRFSSRTGWNLAENALSVDIAKEKAAGRAILDLAESNPTRVGLVGPESLVALLGAPEGSRYRPDALGIASAREAIVADAARALRSLDPSRLVLSASTSEAYTWLFKLLCDPGDEILVPTPSYPLFSYLADVEALRVVSYPLTRDEGFRIDVGALERAISPRTRAIVVVHPNNPTGTLTHVDDAAALDALARVRGLAVISDEVFGDYLWGEPPPSKLRSFAGEREALTFVLSGLSKVVCAPQLKLGWTSVHGPAHLVSSAMKRLEIIADTFLSVSTPVQTALGAILARRPAIQGEVSARLTQNLAALDRAIEAAGPEAPVRRLAADGGWCVVLEVARTKSEDEWVRALLATHGVVVHPGYFFDMDREGFLVVSLLPQPEIFRRAIGSVIETLARA